MKIIHKTDPRRTTRVFMRRIVREEPGISTPQLAKRLGICASRANRLLKLDGFQFVRQWVRVQ